MKPRLIIMVGSLMLAIFFLDRFLASLEHREITAQASSLYRNGEHLLAQGNFHEATVTLARAHSMVRQNQDYQLALARALHGAGRLQEAQSNVRDLLDVDSNSGPANLEMARLLVQTGDDRDAVAYYHRAIYGKWPGSDRGTEVRIELANFLARRGETRQLLPELLLLQDEVKEDSTAEKTLADLFLVADSPNRAAETYLSVLKRDPNNDDALLGLANAELASGDFSKAQSSLHRALRRKPDDSVLTSRLELVSKLTALDPTSRRLSSSEKIVRSDRLLQLTNEDLQRCAQSHPEEQTLAPLIAKADSQMNVKRRPVTNESAEALLDLAQGLWTARQRVCGAPNSQSSGLLLILMRKLQQ